MIIKLVSVPSFSDHKTSECPLDLLLGCFMIGWRLLPIGCGEYIFYLLPLLADLLQRLHGRISDHIPVGRDRD
jgi:hypothetical protein